jgi:hypothetical protein
LERGSECLVVCHYHVWRACVWVPFLSSKLEGINDLSAADPLLAPDSIRHATTIGLSLVSALCVPGSEPPGGAMLALCADWFMILVLIARRHFSPTAGDLQAIRWGYLPILVVMVIVVSLFL